MPKYLYILVRTDMDSLGRGKSVAQGAHAANQFMWDAVVQPAIAGEAICADAIGWSGEAKGFGTTIALDSTLLQMQTAVTVAKLMGFRAALVADPEYPLMDGKTLHLLPNIVTTAYIFGEKADLYPVLGQFKLLENDPVSK